MTGSVTIDGFSLLLTLGGSLTTAGAFVLWRLAERVRKLEQAQIPPERILTIERSYVTREELKTAVGEIGDTVKSLALTLERQQSEELALLRKMAAERERASGRRVGDLR